MIGSFIQKIQQGLNPCESMCNGGGGSQPNNTTSVQTTTKEIPLWAQPSAQNLLSRGEALSNQPYQQYMGDRIADLTPQQAVGLSQVQNRALYGSPEELASRGAYTDTVSGNYLGTGYGKNDARVSAASNPYADMNNPYLKGMVNQALGDVQTRVNSQFGGNNYGTSAHQETLQRGLSDAANSAYGQAYNLNAQLADQNASRTQQASASNAQLADQNASRYQQNWQAERNNMMQGLLLGNQYNNLDYNNAQQLIGVGDYRQEEQDNLNATYSNWQEMMNQPYRQLDVLANALGASVNGAGNVQSAGYANNPYTTNRYAGAIGGGLAGYNLGSALGGENSWGGAAGAGIGGLLGYFGS